MLLYVGGWNSLVVTVCGPLSGLKSNLWPSTTSSPQRRKLAPEAEDGARRRRAASAAGRVASGIIRLDNLIVGCDVVCCSAEDVEARKRMASVSGEDGAPVRLVVAL